MKNCFLIAISMFLCSLTIAQNNLDEVNSIGVNKSEELKSLNNIFLDSNKQFDLPIEGGFLYSSNNQLSELKVGGYENDENYILTIKSSIGHKIILKSQFFNTEKNEDVLKIYDGSDTLKPLLSNLSGVITDHLLIISTNDVITLHFKSNNQNINKGFRFRIDNGSQINNKISGGTLPTPQSCSGTPASDECANAPLICNLNGYCGNTSGAYTAGNTSGLGSFCGSIENNSWIKFIASSTSANLNIISGGC